MCYLSIQTEQMLLPGNWWFSEREAQLLMLFLCVFYMYMQLRLCWTTTNQSSETTFIFSSKRSSYFLLVCAHAHLFHFLTCELHFQELVKQFSTALMFFLVIWQYTQDVIRRLQNIILLQSLGPFWNVLVSER